MSKLIDDLDALANSPFKQPMTTQDKDAKIARLTAEAANWQDALNRMSDQLDEAWGERDAARKVIEGVREISKAMRESTLRGDEMQPMMWWIDNIDKLLGEPKEAQ